MELVRIAEMLAFVASRQIRRMEVRALEKSFHRTDLSCPEGLDEEPRLHETRIIGAIARLEWQEWTNSYRDLGERGRTGHAPGRIDGRLGRAQNGFGSRLWTDSIRSPLDGRSGIVEAWYLPMSYFR